MATIVDFSVYKGEDKTITVTMNPPTNIVGWNIQFTVKASYGGPALITKTVGAGITVLDPANGVFTVQLASADTNNASVGVGAFYYDVQRTDAGNRTVLTIGQLTVLPEVAL